MVRVLFALQSAFSLWMLVDAVQRRCGTHWYFVVLCPFGEWVYFFKVKIHDPEFDRWRSWVKGLVTRKTTIDQLRYRAAQSPSFDNQLALGHGYHDHGAYREALDAFREALQSDPESTTALYGAALSELELGECDAAVRDLRRVIDAEPAFRDYAAWFALSDALVRGGRTEEALAVLEGLVRASPRLGHRVAYAQALESTGRAPQAAEQLRAGLADYDHGPRFLQRRDRGWARMARRMLRSLNAAAGPHGAGG